MENASILAIDLAKHSFQVCGTTADGSVLFNRKYSRGKLQELLVKSPPSVAAMEACSCVPSSGVTAGGSAALRTRAHP